MSHADPRWPLVALGLLLAVSPAAAQQVRPLPIAVAAAAMTAGAALDLHSTLACPECVEVGPLAQLVGGPRRPLGLILLDAATIGAVTALTVELRRSNVATARRWWWVPAAITTAAFVYSWRHNVGATSQ